MPDVTRAMLRPKVVTEIEVALLANSLNTSNFNDQTDSLLLNVPEHNS
jgi:hypothetical protein